MNNSITGTNLVEILEILNLDIEKLFEYLFLGDLGSVENLILSSMDNLYSTLLGSLFAKLHENKDFIALLKKKAIDLELSKLSKRCTTLQLATGKVIKIDSYYAEQNLGSYEGSRWILHEHLGSIERSSITYVSRVAQLSVLTPSFSIGQSVLSNLGCESETEKNRQLTLSMGHLGLKDRAKNMLSDGENVHGKRVVISTDGGRTRTREWKEADKGEGKYGKFDTPWVEPKLLVISIIDEDGKMSKIDLPVLDACFGDDELFELLADYLTLLGIDRAKSVQFIADGAPWIWNRAKKMLLMLGVAEEKIIETLDFYHAQEHLNDLVPYLPKEKQEQTMVILKQQLWQGDIPAMKSTLSQVLPNLEEKPLKPFEYFEKHQHRMQYQKYKEEKLLIGSGIVESGIRRVINLRFKSPSSFWNKENLEPLFYLRAAFLAKRWDILLDNLYQNRRKETAWS
jgi:hypothetical protein